MVAGRGCNWTARLPTLVIHGDDDQVVPFEVGGKASAALIDGATLKVCPEAPHGITDTHKAQLSADLLEFVDTSKDES
jgi:non-heme chloroperoxidase